MMDRARASRWLPRSLVGVLAVLCACLPPRTGAPAATTIVVEEFDIPPVAVVQRYSSPVEPLGMQYAVLLAQRLKRLGYDASAVAKGTPLAGKLRITGSILEVDGGNTWLRLLVRRGAGHTEFDVVGTVTSDDGRTIGDFTESRASTRGFTQARALEKAMLRTARLISRMVYTGDYRLNAPRNRPAAKFYAASIAPPPSETGEQQPSREERLGELDQLRRAGAITRREYKQKRRAILQGR